MPLTPDAGGLPCASRSQVDIGATLGGWTEVATSKTRLREMKRMKDLDIGYHSIEVFLAKMEEKTHRKRGQGRIERKVVRLLMTKKINDEKVRLKEAKARKELSRTRLVNAFGSRSSKTRRTIRYLHRQADKATTELKDK